MLTRVLGMLTASMVNATNCNERRFRLEELQSLIINAPTNVLWSNATEPTNQTDAVLGFVIHSLIQLIKSSQDDCMIISLDLLFYLICKHPKDLFIANVTPGLLTSLLNTLCSQSAVQSNIPLTSSSNQTPLDNAVSGQVSIYQRIINILHVVVQRAGDRIVEDEKFSAVVQRLYLFVSSCKSNLKMQTLFSSLCQLQRSDLLSRTIVMASVLDDSAGSAHSWSVFVEDAVSQLDFLKRELEDPKRLVHSKDISNHLILLDGVLFILNSTVYYENLQTLQMEAISLLIQCIDAHFQICSSIPVIVQLNDGFVWSQSVTSKALANVLRDITRWEDPTILRLLMQTLMHRKANVSGLQTLALLIFEFKAQSESLSNSDASRGTMQTVQMVEMVEYLMGVMEDSHTAIDEAALFLAWCTLAHSVVQMMKDSTSERDHQLITALTICTLPLLGSLSFVVRDAAEQLLMEMSLPGSSVQQHLHDRYNLIIDQLALQLRYPYMYPLAPSALSHLICQLKQTAKDCVSVTMEPLGDVIRVMVEQAPNMQLHVGYILLLMRALGNCCSVCGVHNSVNIKVLSDMIPLIAHFACSDEWRVRIAALEAMASVFAVLCPLHGDLDPSAGDTDVGDAKEMKQKEFNVLPLVHLVWRHVVRRLLGESCREVLSAALSVLQAQMSGSSSSSIASFLRDRVEKELVNSSVLLQKCLGSKQLFCQYISVLKLVWDSSEFGKQIMGSSIPIGLLTRAIVCHAASICNIKSNSIATEIQPYDAVTLEQAVDLIRVLAMADADKVWFALRVQMGSEESISVDDCVYDLDSYKIEKSNTKQSLLADHILSLISL